MKDENKHLYRIDPLKVKQKLYSLYPQGSEEHKMMAKQEKIKEYTQLAKSVSSMPVELVKEVADQNKVTALKLTAIAGAFLLIGTVFTGLLLIAHTQLELILIGILMVLSYTQAFTKFLMAMKLAYSIKNFEDAFKKTKARMEKLQGEIFP